MQCIQSFLISFFKLLVATNKSILQPLMGYDSQFEKHYFGDQGYTW